MRTSQMTGLSLLSLLLGACATPAALLPVPEARAVTLPDNPEAAEMTARFASVMERKLPILDRVAIIMARDRYVREVFVPQFSEADLDADVRKQFQDHAGQYVMMVDTLNTAELKSVLRDYSWADIVEGEPALFRRLFHVVQHSPDMAFRADVLAEIRPYAEQGLVEKQEYALMYDKVELSLGRQQLYGTQYKCIGGRYEIYDLKDPETVDTRRAGMDMVPLQEYIEVGRAYYGPCTDD